MQFPLIALSPVQPASLVLVVPLQMDHALQTPTSALPLDRRASVPDAAPSQLLEDSVTLVILEIVPLLDRLVLLVLALLLLELLAQETTCVQQA